MSYLEYCFSAFTTFGYRKLTLKNLDNSGVDCSTSNIVSFFSHEDDPIDSIKFCRASRRLRSESESSSSSWRSFRRPYALYAKRLENRTPDGLFEPLVLEYDPYSFASSGRGLKKKKRNESWKRRSRCCRCARIVVSSFCVWGKFVSFRYKKYSRENKSPKTARAAARGSS